jgi:hypothetical protein
MTGWEAAARIGSGDWHLKKLIFFTFSFFLRCLVKLLKQVL